MRVEARTSSRSRPLVLSFTVLILFTVGLGIGSAQTVSVVGAPRESTVEVVLNNDVVGTVPVDSTGVATVPLKRQWSKDRPEGSVNLFVDSCPKLVRVVMMEAGHAQAPPAPSAGCTRRAIEGTFVMRAVTSFVVDTTTNTVMLSQGPAPRGWLYPQGGSLQTPGSVDIPVGLVLSGGGQIAAFSDAVTVACGDVATCSGKGTRPGVAASATYWFSRYLAVDGGYLHLANVTASGEGGFFRFNNELDPRIFTVGVMAGGPVDRVRFYGRVGATYHWARTTSSQTFDDRTITVDDEEQTIPGGTILASWDTKGWGWGVGGGAEIWARRAFGFYGELRFEKLKGKPATAGEARLDELVRLVTFGVRFRINP